MLEKFPNKNWCFDMISSNSALTIEMLKKFPNKNWNMKMILYNRNINKIIMKKIFMEKYIDKYINKFKYSLSINENITKKIIEKYIDKIDFHSLSSNKFTYHNKMIIEIPKKIKLFYYLSFVKVMIYDINRYLTTF
jgi:hypothetical protein